MAAKAKRTVEKRDDSEFKKLCAQLEKAKTKVNDFEEEHEEMIAAYKKLNEDVVGIQEKLKIEARKFAVLGGTKTLWTSKLVSVTVMGKENRVFDINKAQKVWPEAVLEKAIVEVVDLKALDQLVSEGALSESEMQRCCSFVPATAAVTVRFL